MPKKLLSRLFFRRKKASPETTPENKPKIKVTYIGSDTPIQPERKIRSDSDPHHKRPPRRMKKPVRKHEKSETSEKTPNTPPWSLDDFQVPPEKGKIRFHDIGLDDRIMHAIHELGFKYCTPVQAKTLLHAKKGENVAGRAQTGTGKTAAFLIMIFQRFLNHPSEEQQPKGTPRALVMAPTRELVMQIHQDAVAMSKYCKIRSVAVYGGMDFNKQQKQLEQHIDLVAATPGRLLDFMNRNVIDVSKVETLVIDEADRMLDMGFIPDIKKIIRATTSKTKRRTMLFSATLTDDVMRLASQWMPDPVIVEIDPEHVTVDTVDQQVYAISSAEKFTVLLNILKRENAGKVLIFRNRRHTTEKLCNELNRAGVKCEMISGAVSQKQRVKVLENFKAGRTKILVATDVAGRGIHVDDISHVINYDFPYEPEDYVHRIGRTGRAGIKGIAISFACEEESFIIPDIEEYIGRKLPCQVPDEGYLAKV